MIVLNPVGKQWFDVLAPEQTTGESHAFVGLDAFSRARVDIHWKRKEDPKKLFAGTTRRTGSPRTEIDDARGFAGLIPLRDGSPFFVIGDSSGFPRDLVRLKEHGDRKGTGGWGWGTLTWDHWPVGWLNSQAHDQTAETFARYPSHFAPFGLDLWSIPDATTETVTSTRCSASGAATPKRCGDSRATGSAPTPHTTPHVPPHNARPALKETLNDER